MKSSARLAKTMKLRLSCVLHSVNHDGWLTDLRAGVCGHANKSRANDRGRLTDWQTCIARPPLIQYSVTHASDLRHPVTWRHCTLSRHRCLMATSVRSHDAVYSSHRTLDLCTPVLTSVRSCATADSSVRRHAHCIRIVNRPLSREFLRISPISCVSPKATVDLQCYLALTV